MKYLSWQFSAIIVVIAIIAGCATKGKQDMQFGTSSLLCFGFCSSQMATRKVKVDKDKKE